MSLHRRFGMHTWTTSRSARRSRRKGTRTSLGGNLRHSQLEQLEKRELLAFGEPILNFEGQGPSAALSPPDTRGRCGQGPLHPDGERVRRFALHRLRQGNGQAYFWARSRRRRWRLRPRLAPSARVTQSCTYDELADRWLVTELLATRFVSTWSVRQRFEDERSDGQPVEPLLRSDTIDIPRLP